MEFEIERNPLFPFLPEKTKGAQNLIKKKNMVSYSLGIDNVRLV